MKKIFYLILVHFLLTFNLNAQIASRLLPSQAHVQGINAKNIVWVDTVAGGQQRIWVADRDSLKLYTFQIRGVKDSVQNWGDARYPQLTATYFNPTFIGSIAANKLTGLNALMISSALGYTPADSIALSVKLNILDTTNKWLGVGYSPSNSQVISALGGTPLFSEVDGSITNELQTLSKSGTNVTLSNSGGTVSINDSDSSNTNELQTLSIVNRIITLSNAGGTVTIPYQSYDSLTNKPTIPTNTNQLTNGSGYITQAQARTSISLTTTGSGAATYNNSTGVLNIPTSTTKRIETYSGNTNSSGEYTITFGTAFSTAPNIQASITNQTNPQQFIMVSAVSTTGCTIKVVQRNASFLSLLGLDVLTTGVTNVNNAPVDVLVTSK